MPLHQVSSTPAKLNTCGSNGTEPRRSSSREGSIDFNGHEPTRIPTSEYRCLIDRIKDRIKRNVTFCSFEFFPPKTVSGSANLIKM